MQRAAVSIASNIAEGCERGGRDFSRFLRIALGSTAELRTQLYIARKLGDFDDEKLRSLISETKEISKMLTGLRKSLVDPKINPPQKNAPLQLKTESLTTHPQLLKTPLSQQTSIAVATWMALVIGIIATNRV